MQLKDLKSQVNKSIKKLSTIIHQKKKIISLKFLFIIFMPIFLILLIIFFLNISNLFPHLKINKAKNNDNALYRLAENAYNKGYLENSAIYYQNYINSNTSKTEKIIAYKRLFEIAVLKKNLEQALSYLDKIQSIDKNIPEIYINRIKILIRLNQYAKAKKEIIKQKNKLKKSVEFKEISAVYYMKISEYKKALIELKSIIFKKREIGTHIKIIQCYLSLNQLKDCLGYIDKIEHKIESIEDRETKGKLLLLKGITKVLNSEIDDVMEELKRASVLSSRYKDTAIKLLLFCNILLDKPEDVFVTMQNDKDDLLLDIDILKLIGDYYIYKNDYQKSLYFYEKIKKLRELTKDELMTSANLYYVTGEYESSIKNMENLFKKYNYKSPTLFKNISIAYGKTKDYQNEIFFLKEGILQYPTDLDFYTRLAKIYIDKKDANMALQYINEGKNVYKNNTHIFYDKRLDFLNITASQINKTSTNEKELLDLREKEIDNPEYYFKIIRYYLEQHKFIEAKREIETVIQLPMNEPQKEILYTYKLILALYMENYEEYKKSQENLFSLKTNSDITKINIAIIYIFNNDYNKALEELHTLKTNSFSQKLKNKIFFLQSV
ncbi:MAG: hypothetical protein KAT05_05790, partial [Spirochaetes bacterium]|nr:hypothetical protein [Spirochaetota bacterium]